MTFCTTLLYAQKDEEIVRGKSKKDVTFSPPTKGSLSLVSNIPDAQIFINNNLKGTTKDGKLTIPSIEKGTYKIEARHPDYSDFSQSVAVTPGKLALVNALMQPNFGYLVLPNVKQDATLKVEVDGKPLTDPAKNLQFKGTELYVKISPPGDHTVRILKGVRAIYNKKFTVKPESPKVDVPEPETATLIVQSDPPLAGAKVFVDGVYINNTNEKGVLRLADLSPDSHRIQIEDAKYKPYDYVVPVTTEKDTTLQAVLEKIIEYFDPFENLEKWDAPPAWKTGSQMLHVTGDKTLGLVKTIGYRTADVSFDFKLGAAGRASWVIRSDEDKKNYYLFSLNAPTPTTASLQAYVCKDGVLKMEKELRIYNPIEKNKWNHMRVKVEGNKISHFLTPSDATDFISIGLYEDSKNLFEFGTIGFATLGNEDFFVAGSFTVCPEIDGCRPEIKAPEPKTVVPPKKGE
ncbi:MAG: PEGA domain-containing protein [Blastocatellia bacterium]|nr:PEGA domain-containing protein [Blastocatellia bacterium]